MSVLSKKSISASSSASLAAMRCSERTSWARQVCSVEERAERKWVEKRLLVVRRRWREERGARRVRREE